MQPKAFGEKLKYYRRQTQDKARGAYLTQARLADLINLHFGISNFSFQQISYWEQGKYLPKDREMLQALVKILMTYQGISSLAEANQWLNLGGYASFSEAEVQAIGAEWPHDELLETDSEAVVNSPNIDIETEASPSPGLLDKDKSPITSWVFHLTTHRLLGLDGYIMSVSIVGGALTCLFLRDFFDWPFTDYETAIQAHIKLGLANFFIPITIHLLQKTDEPSLTSWSAWLSRKLFTNAAARAMYSITLLGYLAVASLTYWLDLWPWPIILQLICWVAFWLMTYSFMQEVKYWPQSVGQILYVELAMAVAGQILTLLAWFTYTSNLPIYWVIVLSLPLILLLAKFDPSPRTFLMIILGIVAFACSLMGLQVLLVLMGS